MLIKFHKMQSLGNDFVIIDKTQIQHKLNSDFFKKISDRHFGIGCDLIAFYEIKNIDEKANTLFLETSFFNSDGSEAEICGNATHCIGLLMKKLKNISACIMKASNREYKIEILSNDSTVVHWNNKIEIESFDVLKKLGENITKNLNITSAYLVSVGNPHCILFLKKIPSVEMIKKIGKQIESHPIFPNKTNVEFVQKLSDNLFEINVFERGVGLTLGCGSGAMAVAFAVKKSGITIDNLIKIRQKGGVLEVNFQNDEDFIQLGHAEYIFLGEFSYDFFQSDTGHKFGDCSVFNSSTILSADTVSVNRDNIIATEIPTHSSKHNFTSNLSLFDSSLPLSSSSFPDFQSDFSNKGLDKKIVIYTDGACSGNPGPGGWGVIIINYQGNNQSNVFAKENYFEISGGEENTTNNRMELTAVIKAIEQINFSKLLHSEIEIFTDSQYVKNGITQWIQKWLSNNWKNSDNKPVKNKDLWIRLLELSKNQKIIWSWLKGHNGDKFNERADFLAREQIQKLQ